MKKVLLITSSLTLLFSSCQKQNLDGDMLKKNDLPNYGEKHNMVVNHLYNANFQQNLTFPLSKDESDNIINEAHSYASSQGWDVTGFDLGLASDRLRDIINNSDDTEEHLSYLDSEIEAAGEDLNLSDNAINMIKGLYRINESEMSIGQYFDFMESELNNLSTNDQTVLQSIISIGRGSEVLWEGALDHYVNDLGLKRSTWVIIYDTIGGVFGFVLGGGIGSVILGGAMSAAMNESP